MTDLIIDFENCKFTAKDLELIQFSIGENPTGTCKIQNLNFAKSSFGKIGAKYLETGLAINNSILHLDLSSTKMGVSGVVHIS